MCNISKNNLTNKYLKKGDIILEKSGGSDKQPVGRVVYFDGPEDSYLFNNFTGLLRVKEQKEWLPKYVFWALYALYKQGKTRQFENKTTGLHNLQSDAYVKKTDIKQVDFSKQIEISSILDKLRCQIKTRKNEINNLDVLVKARFVEMFGDPIKNPRRWKESKLNEGCVSILGGGTPSKSHPEYFVGKIPWVTPKDMKKKILRDSSDHITEEAIEKSSTKLIPTGSVLMVIRSGILKHDLPLAINAVPVTINQDMKAFVPKNQILKEYLLYYFVSIESDVLSKVRAVTADNIDFKEFQKRRIPIPPIELQQEFASFVQQVDKSKVVVKKISKFHTISQEMCVND